MGWGKGPTIPNFDSGGTQKNIPTAVVRSKIALFDSCQLVALQVGGYYDDELVDRCLRICMLSSFHHSMMTS